MRVRICQKKFVVNWLSAKLALSQAGLERVDVSSAVECPSAVLSLLRDPLEPLDDVDLRGRREGGDEPH
jgi:hypothetical protein